MAGSSALDDGVLVESGVAGVSNDDVRCRFEGFLAEFLSEIYPLNCFLPLPPMLGDGHRVDLYKLFLVVKGKGGYDAVCDSKLWDLVAEESGLGLSVGSSVKLVYCKYLSALDAWLKKVAAGKVPECGSVDDRYKFVRRLMELQDEVLSDYAEDGDGKEFRSEFDECRDGMKLCGSDGDKKVWNGGGYPDLGSPDCETNESVCRKLFEGDDAMEVLEEFDGGKVSAEPVLDVSDAVNIMPALSGGGEKCDDVLVLDQSGGDKEVSGLKRKRESLSDLLSWVTDVAKNPCDPQVGSLPEKSKWKAYGNQEVWKQVLSFREAAMIKRGFESSIEQHSWQSQKMHPCMYDDHLGATYNLRERWKCDKRLSSGKLTSSVRSSSESSVGTEGDLDRTPSPHTEDRAEKQLVDSSHAHSGLDGSATLRIPLGSRHQTDVPEWTGVPFESDPKWLGTQIWPSDKVNSRLLIERDPIGKGRQDSCGCSVPGSVECVRFHISEKRAKVKLELGMAFYQWNFDKIGEEVGKFWTKEEQKKFKDGVLSKPPPENCFWDHIFGSFPEKKREQLVSYYFNVFLLQRRGYQNRHTPDNIDSDDDESESGPLRNVFGHQTQKSRSSILLTPKKPQTKGR